MYADNEPAVKRNKAVINDLPGERGLPKKSR